MALSDDFNRADSATVGNGWAELTPDKAYISGNALAIDNGGSGEYPTLACVAPASADMADGTIVVDFSTDTVNAQPQVHFRRTPGGDFYLAFILSSVLYISKYISGSYSTVASSAMSAPFAAGKNYRFTITLSGTSKTCVLTDLSDNSELATATDSADSTLTASGSVALSNSSGVGTVFYDRMTSGVVADTTAPTFSVAPAVSAVTQTTADLDATIDETGDIHWVVVGQADAAPTIANIQAGQANGGGAVVDSGNMLAGTVLDTQITGLTAGTDYAVYLVAQDDESTPNVQASPAQVNFSTSAVSDTVPDQFSFTDQVGVALSTLITSNTVNIAGINAPSSITVTGGEMSINSGAFTTVTTTVNNGDTVQLRQTSSDSNSIQTVVTLNVGGVSDDWSVTTVAAASQGTITTSVMKNNTGVVLANASGIIANVYSLIDGSMVARKTGLTSNSSGVVSFSDVAIAASVTYLVTLHIDTADGLERLTAV